MRHNKIALILATAIPAFACIGAAASGPAFAAAPPQLKVYTVAPEEAPSGVEPTLSAVIENTGRSVISGAITFTETLSPGWAAPTADPRSGQVSGGGAPTAATTCQTAAMTITCTYPGPLLPGTMLRMYAKTKVEAKVAGEKLTGDVTVSSEGAVVRAHEETTVTVLPGPFAFTFGAAELLDASGAQSTQAASDPSTFTTTLQWRSFASFFGKKETVISGVGHFKDVTAHLPPGMIGNPSATPAVCTTQQLAEVGAEGANVPDCPRDSQIGVVRVYLTFGLTNPRPTPLYNIVPPRGVATELGFEIYQTDVLLQAHVRPGDHGIDIVSNDTSTSAPVTRVEVEVWGVPSDPSHDPVRGACLNTVFNGSTGEVCGTSAPRKAFLRLPTGCSGKPLDFGAEANTYEHTNEYASIAFDGPVVTGCDAVPFNPSITLTPTSTATASPTGVDVKLSLPQSNSPDGLQEADLKKAVVTLPEGMTINPSAADGLAACDDAHLRLESNTPADCPNGSKVGTVLLHTQLIANPIEGSIYIRPQASSDPMSGEMFRIAIELRDDSHGLDIKVPGQIQANPVTGRLTTTFDENPQFPFEDISLKFKAGARAPLVTPPSCTPGPTEAALYSYAEPEKPVRIDKSFALSSGPEGTGCTSQQGFTPGFDAGVQSVQAGGFTPFLSTFTRKDSDQGLNGVSVTLPLGLSGSLVGLPLCPQSLAAAGKCEAASEIGTVTAGAGAGPTPLYVTGGKAFMTGSYEGAPFGLSIVVPAKAGPFDLGNVNVRAKVEVDPHTTQLTVTSDPIPVIVGGVPVNVRLVNVTVNRPKFVFNPTNCDPLTVTGRMTGAQGATTTVSNHFQVTNCGALKFQPKFSVSASGKTSRANGASLDAKLSYPRTEQGTQANIATVKVSLPKQLPSRLTTLQKACTAATFEANPAACPAASRIGIATATTPVIPVPLSGPTYFVSHGGAAFPDLVVVLQGYGVTVDLVGTTFISKAGITSTTFKTVPDVPVGTFELKLPQGPFSALAANGDLCTLTKTVLVKRKVTVKSEERARTVTREVRKVVAGGLAMPTTFTAQNGAVIKQNTPIAVTGCPKKKAQASSHRKRGREGAK